MIFVDIRLSKKIEKISKATQAELPARYSLQINENLTVRRTTELDSCKPDSRFDLASNCFFSESCLRCRRADGDEDLQFWDCCQWSGFFGGFHDFNVLLCR